MQLNLQISLHESIMGSEKVGKIMNANSELKKQLKEGNGYLIRSKALDNGISRDMFEAYVTGNELQKVAAGIYVDKETWTDELYVLSVRNSKIVFSHETALYLHSLMDREPKLKTVTVKHGYNASHLRQKGIRVVSVAEKYYNIGVSEIETSFGNPVRVYDMERTICDVVRNKDKMDIQVYKTAIKEYMKRKDKNLSNLIKYSQVFNVEDKIRLYTEVFL